MTQPRRTVAFEVDGKAIAALAAGPESAAGKPLIAALHGGTYNARYFDVAGSDGGTFMDLAAAGGYPVVSFDRPGYGASFTPEPADNTFDLHARLLADVIGQAARGVRADSVCSWSATRSAA
jgi:pimeloyl-ACP methyl ester carboxylesterase